MSHTSPGADGPVVEVAGLRKRYASLVAVDGIDFTVERGQVFGLLGPNGAGKTTTVEILEGLRVPDEGTVRVLGFDVRHEPAGVKERIGVQLQTPSLYPFLTVGELLNLFRSFYRHSAPLRQLVDAVDLGERVHAQTRHLSGGQRQRLSVALALVNDPELVFLDEPTTGLDPQARRLLWDLVLQMRDQGRSVLLTTHYMEEAEQLCDRVAIMDHGHILELGSVDELVSRRFHERAVTFDAMPGLGPAELGALPSVKRAVSEDGETVLYTADVAATIAALLARADAAGQEPRNLAIRRATLEDVFLDLTGHALRE